MRRLNGGLARLSFRNGKRHYSRFSWLLRHQGQRSSQCRVAAITRFGERVVPFFEEFFQRAKRFEARRDIAFHVIAYARNNEAAFRIGLAAITDRSTHVRYRGCCVLAYSLRRDVLPSLKKLLGNPDAKTADDARAAINAIQMGNHHFFVDRKHTGQMFWEVRPGDHHSNRTMPRNAFGTLLSRFKWQTSPFLARKSLSA